MNKFQELDSLFRKWKPTKPQWRIGQTYFNCLTQVDSELAEEIRGTETDPFYVDDRLPSFFEKLAEKWS